MPTLLMCCNRYSLAPSADSTFGGVARPPISVRARAPSVTAGWSAVCLPAIVRSNTHGARRRYS